MAPLLSLCPHPPCSETLPVEYLGGKPLCMNQYYQILSSCRVPGPKQDTVISFSKTKKPPMHITVVHNYQVRGLPACCRGGWGRAEKQLPLRPCPQAPRKLGISTASLIPQSQPEGSQEGAMVLSSLGESQARSSSALIPVT